MNNHQPLTMNQQPPKTGFTLVEMLVVIAIIGILMAMMIPAAGMILRRATIARAKSDAGVVTTVLLKYQAEYNRWPDTYLPAGEGMTDAAWVTMMAPNPDAGTYPANPKRIIFFDAGGGALASASGLFPGAFVDPWGKPFQFRVDMTGTGEMENPDTGMGGIVRGRALAWSAGPDGDYDTWVDANGRPENVKSWE